ncbi:hypothetical protein [Alkaliphilus metalliredigens]|nr:hypothetical protein [Alkaliphilus metalliredigens]
MEFSIAGLLQLGLIMFVLMLAVGSAGIILCRIVMWIIWRE